MGSAWLDTDLVFTIRAGRLIEPRKLVSRSGASARTTRSGPSRSITSGMPSDRCSRTWAFRSRRRAALVLLEHEQALHAIAAILIEHETIDREQFERLRQSEPEETALAPYPRPEQATTSETARKRRTRPTAAGAAKHLPSALVAHAVQPEDLKPQATRG